METHELEKAGVTAEVAAVRMIAAYLATLAAPTAERTWVVNLSRDSQLFYHRKRKINHTTVRLNHRWEVDHAPAGPVSKRSHTSPNQVLVGHVACLGHGGGGHTQA